MQLIRFSVTQNHTEEPWTEFSTARDAGKMLHERKVMQNLSNATTKIQLNSIPEKKTSKRETFFSSYLGNARSDTEKKDMEFILNLPFARVRAFLLCYFCMLLFSLFVFSLFHLFLSFSSPLYEDSFRVALAAFRTVWGGGKSSSISLFAGLCLSFANT